MPRDFEVLKHWRPEPPTQRELDAMEGLERGDFEIYRNRLELNGWEAYQTFARMGISPMVEAGDCAVGVYTRQGDLAIGIMGTQLHLINGAIGIKWMMRHFYEEPSVGVHEGDMFYANDPLYGGIHNSDQILFMPLFWEGELVAWIAVASHETETGATEPGGNPPSGKSRYDDGLLLSPIKIAENYKLKADLMEMMENRIRDPRMQTLDIKARAAGAHILERRCHEIIERKGVDFFIGSLRRMLDEGAQAAREKLATMNDGIYRCDGFLENAGNAKNGLIRASVEVEKRGEECWVRFSGSPRVEEGNFNSYPHAMIAQVACYLFQFFFYELPNTTGYYEPFHFEFQKASLLMAEEDDCTSLGVVTIAHVSTILHAAMEKMKFGSEYRDTAVAPWGGGSCTTAIGGMTREGLQFATWDQGQPNGQGMGARWDKDGIDAGGFVWCAIGEFLDTEPFEHNYPILPMFRSVYWRDAAGYGKFRGGRSMHAMYRVHNTPMAAGVALGGYSNRPVAPGLFGGYPGRPVAVAYVQNHNLDELIERGETPRDIYEAVERIEGDWTVCHTTSEMFMLGEGDLIITTAPSGPGYGDVLQRDPEMVIDDLRQRSISHETAEEIFKVVYDKETLTVDEEATALRRKEQREERLAKATPYDEWVDGWLERRPPDEVLEFYGDFPKGSYTRLVDWEPTEELLDEHIREGGEPRPRASRY